MLIYNRVVVEHVGYLFAVCLAFISCLMLMVMGVEQFSALPQGMSLLIVLEYVLLECVHVACWVFPTALYVALTLWAMMAMESQLIYRLFHAGWNRYKIYCVQALWIMPVFVLSIVLNFYYLPIARIAQKLLLHNVYQKDVMSYLNGDRFHTLTLGDDKWVIYFSKKHKKNQLYAFKKSTHDAFSVMYAPETYTDKKQQQLVLSEGTRLDVKQDVRWPMELWTFKQYAFNLPVPQFIGDNDRANYKVDIFHMRDMNHFLEIYSRCGRVMMLLILSFVPLLLIEVVTSRKHVYIIQRALIWYVLYWMVFVLCRWILMWDNFQHISLVAMPHIIMLMALYIYYMKYVRGL